MARYGRYPSKNCPDMAHLSMRSSEQVGLCRSLGHLPRSGMLSLAIHPFMRLLALVAVAAEYIHAASPILMSELSALRIEIGTPTSSRLPTLGRFGHAAEKGKAAIVVGLTRFPY